MASEDPFPSWDALEEAVHMTWGRKHLCRAAPADASCGEPGGQWDWSPHRVLCCVFVVVNPFRTQTSVLAQGHVEMVHRPRAAQGLVCRPQNGCLDHRPCMWVCLRAVQSGLGLLLVILRWAWKQVTCFPVAPSKSSVYDHIFYFDSFHKWENKNVPSFPTMYYCIDRFSCKSWRAILNLSPQ